MAMNVDMDSDDGGVLADINVTPLVDVMLVLLVIFMVTAPLINPAGVPVELPKTASSAPIKKQDEALWVTIDAKGAVYIDKRKLSPEEFDEKFRIIVQELAPKDVYLRADEQVPYGHVARAMAEIQAAGVSRVGMVTEPAGKRKGRRR